MFKKNLDNAQGTTEYLIVIAIIVVIGLIIANLSTNIFDQTQITQTNEQLKGTIGTSGISIIDAIADYETEGILNLKNNSGETLTLTKITTEEGTQEYDNEQWVQGNTELININNLCQCETGQTKKTCNFQIEYTTQHGLTKKITQTITVNCQTEITTTKTPIQPIDITPPIITLITPENNTNTANKTITFNFNVQEEGTINSCTLNTENDTNTYTEIENGNNSIIYAFQNDFLTDWNISCTDESNNTGYSTTRTLDVDSNAYQITTCIELQEINLDLDGDYELMNNIDCEGINFEPIGYCDTDWGCDVFNDVPFTGNFNGNNKIISNLIINRPTINGVGLFGHSTGNISNIGLDNVNISGSARTGGLIGWQSSGTILNSYTTGSVKHEIGNYGGVGGLIGWLSDGGIISKSYSTATVSCNKGQAGGLVGRQHNSVIINSYATGNISGSTYIGGLVGYMGESDFIGATITNSYSTGNVTGSINDVGGLVGYQRSYSENTLTISSSFSTGIVTCPGDGNGGLVGKQYNGGSISNSYFDKTGDKLDYMCGIGIEGSGCDNEKGIDTTLQPNYFYSSSNSPLSSWSSSDWILSGNDYPILQWQTE